MSDTGIFDVSMTPPASNVKVRLHSNGSFTAPPELSFKDYTASQINDLSLCNQENILEALIKVLNENSFEQFDVTQLTQDELVEILSTILVNWWRKEIKIPFICECQDIYPDSEKESSYAIIDLTKIEVHPVPDTVKEPFFVTDKRTNIKTQWRFIRVGDILMAQDWVKKKHKQEQWKIDTFKKHGIPAEEVKRIKQEMQETLDETKSKDLVTMVRARCLVAINDIPVKDDEKIKAFFSIDPDVITSLFKRMSDLQIGLEKEHDVECPLCLIKKKRRLLFQFLLFLPLSGSRELTDALVFTGI